MPATPSPNYSDKQFLSGDPIFQSRVTQALLAACSSIKNEVVTTAFHREREQLLVNIMNTPSQFKGQFSIIVANDTNVIGDATVAGTVAITSGAIAATQAALVTDAHIDTAIAANFNSFIKTPGF